ncbi:MAG: alpha,alpha-trehalose-phosphate synthase (UDP-forming) [Parvibaculaceae bacterium]|nr:alpha,alpha-trehalose-phosphate synthase (UDP-forming) [Parvibaculaceae bacterium]
MTGRLVVVSNRVGPVKDVGRAGGLAVALVDALKSRDGIWYGWSGKIDEASGTKLTLEGAGNLTLCTLDLTEKEYDDYYNGFANRCLWPLFHYRIDLTAFDRQYYDGYLRVNNKFARGLNPLLRPEDLIWVHDYHFLAFAHELRSLGAQQRMGFFLHIPFPSREVLATLPNHDALVRALFAYDVVGFQTQSDCDRFTDYVIHEAEGSVLGDRIRAYGRTIEARAFPIGIDALAFAGMAKDDGEAKRQDLKMRKMLGERAQIIGVDRLDYTKGLPERFLAFERLLEDYGDLRGKVTLLQIAPVSRAEVEEYKDIRAQLEGMTGHINGRFSEYDWTPLRYLNRPFSRRSLAGLYRASKVGLVTPLRDGMNLVAKEYVAAQDDEAPGVLVLSRFAGAARQMREALIVNPYDIKGVADALKRALDMPLEERKERHASLKQGLIREDAAHWRDDFLQALAGETVS